MCAAPHSPPVAVQGRPIRSGAPPLQLPRQPESLAGLGQPVTGSVMVVQQVGGTLQALKDWGAALQPQAMVEHSQEANPIQFLGWMHGQEGPRSGVCPRSTLMLVGLLSRPGLSWLRREPQAT